MVQGIAIMGLNGSGKSTLAHALAKRIDYYEMDVEDYYFPEQKSSRRRALENEELIETEHLGELPFSSSRLKSEVQEAIMQDIERYSKFIISGVTMSWNDEVLSKLDVAFMVKAPLEIRLRRIQYREEKRFGNRVLPGGDMHEQQIEFQNVVQNRDERMVEDSAKRLKCPIIVLDGTADIMDNLDKIINIIDNFG